jgi:hypothetical protein
VLPSHVPRWNLFSFFQFLKWQMDWFHVMGLHVLFHRSEPIDYWKHLFASAATGYHDIEIWESIGTKTRQSIRFVRIMNGMRIDMNFMMGDRFISLQLTDIGWYRYIL